VTPASTPLYVRFSQLLPVRSPKPVAARPYRIASRVLLFVFSSLGLSQLLAVWKKEEEKEQRQH